jgi:hypothetical protein
MGRAKHPRCLICRKPMGGGSAINVRAPNGRLLGEVHGRHTLRQAVFAGVWLEVTVRGSDCNGQG